MKRIYSLLFLCICLSLAYPQSVPPGNGISPAGHRQAATIETNLVHTLLKIQFDFNRAHALGKVWLTLMPHFYPSDSLHIDAKGMDIHQVALCPASGPLKPLQYSYDSATLHIKLDRQYKGGEKYKIFIDYIARPDEYKIDGAYAATRKGMYFINPKGEEKNKPTQIWTFGETEATSIWCPTIDRPNQHSTQETYITVPVKYVSLSNGLLINSVKNNDATRTDHWKLDQPNVPYLFFIAVGEFTIIKDKCDGIGVNYYVEKQYASAASRIFGATPEMIRCFSGLTGVRYPWPGYSQVIVRDFFSGAMENTTATLHNQDAAQDAREMVEGNKWENTIAHELFHHWFGDYVTAESWNNLTLNESFATYGEILWLEHKYGKNKADELYYNKMLDYLYGNNQQKQLVRPDYSDWQELFDAVTYGKGAAVLHMLRTRVGDSAFFRSLNRYLVTNRFRSAEVDQLRLAFEEVTGEDLTWFFHQWYFRSGHPQLDITQEYNEDTKLVMVTVRQQDSLNVFRIDCAVDIYAGGSKKRYPVELTKREEVFRFASDKRPDLVNFDGDKTVLCTKNDHKPLDQFVYQFKNAGSYIDKREAINACYNEQKNPAALALLSAGLTDADMGIRFHTVMFLINLNPDSNHIRKAVEPLLINMAKGERGYPVKAAAVHLLGMNGSRDLVPLFTNLVGDSSYNVSGEALEALSRLDITTAIGIAGKMKVQARKGKLAEVTGGILMKYGSEADFDFYCDYFDKMVVSEGKFQLLNAFADCLDRIGSPSRFRKGIDAIVRFREAVPEPYRKQTTGFINQTILKNIAGRKKTLFEKEPTADIQAQIQYVLGKIDGTATPR